LGGRRARALRATVQNPNTKAAKREAKRGVDSRLAQICTGVSG